MTGFSVAEGLKTTDNPGRETSYDPNYGLKYVIALANKIGRNIKTEFGEAGYDRTGDAYDSNHAIVIIPGSNPSDYYAAHGQYGIDQVPQIAK